MKLEFKVAVTILIAWGVVAMYKDVNDSKEHLTTVNNRVTVTKASASPVLHAANSIPEWADNAETALFLAVHSTFKSQFDCKKLRSPVDDEWLIGCAPIEGELMPFLLFAATKPVGRSPFRISAINGKAKQYSARPAMSEIVYDTTSFRTDINIDDVIYQYQHN